MSSNEPEGSHRPRIFVNYRRDDTAGDTGRLYDALIARFGKSSIFMDVDTIQPGADFAELINDTVGSCEVLISVIGKTWLTQSAAGGQRRLDDEQDLVRLEILSALEHKVRVVPVLVQGAQMPRADQLPAVLARLAGKNAFEISYSRWQYDVQKLIDALDKLASPSEASKHNLPRQLTSFVGRGEDVAAAARTVLNARLLTLTGTGGIGKSRLALQVAGELGKEYRDGAWLVELAPVAAPDLVPKAVAVALGVPEQSGREIAITLTEFLRPRRALVVLDNCEHLVEAVARLVEALLRACPELHILATSREALGIGGEEVSRVRSLSVPGAADRPTAESVAGYEAVALFCDRATTAVGDFALSDKTAPLVAQICQRLDGIPLAIELAAARLKVLSLEQIVQRLDNRFSLLTGGSRTALPRQQTLRATIDWSFQLLSEAERALLRRLSVFTGGAGIEAVEAICAGDLVEAGDVLDLLTELTTKSLLLVASGGDEARYQLLETIRQFGQDRLRESGEIETLRRRHADWFVSLAARAERELAGPEQVIWSELLEMELDNLRAAFEWSTQALDAKAGLQLATGLGRFWYTRGHLSDGQSWLDRSLAISSEPSTLRAQAFVTAARLASYLGADERARELANEGLELFRLNSDQRGVGAALRSLGLVAIGEDDDVRAVALLRESVTVLRKAGDKAGVAESLWCLGQSLMFIELESAPAPLEEALPLFRELGDKRYIAQTIGTMGRVALHQRRYAAAAELLEESITLAREVKDQGVTTLLLTLGTVERCRGNLAAAKVALDESLGIFRQLGQDYRAAYSLCELGIVARVEGDFGRAAGLLLESLSLSRDRYCPSRCLEAMAGVACGKNQPRRAAALFGAAQALRDSMSMSLEPFESADHDAFLLGAKSLLGEPEFNRAWSEGFAMSQEQATAFASGARGAS